MKLSRTERWILSNQCLILEALHPEETETYKTTREALERGYELHYEWLTEYIYDDDDVMPVEECMEVVDILTMFRALKDAYDALADKSGIDNTWVKFGGFDGNNEAKYLSYARFLIEREGRFSEFDQGDKFDKFNSHVPVLGQYRAMLTEWKICQNIATPTKDDLIRITNA